MFNTIFAYFQSFGFSVFWFLVIFIPLVIIHEFGHLIAARLCGVRIPEFGIGMPFTRRLFHFKKFGIIWSFYPILLGGFVRIWGDNDAMDFAASEYKTNPKQAREDYIIQRVPEIIASRELEFVLVNNSLDYDKSWQKLESSKFIFGENIDSEQSDNELFERLLKQLQTIVGWEFDSAIKQKNIFSSKNWLQQTVIILGGVTFNTIVAILCFWAIAGLTFIANKPVSVNIEDFGSIQKFATISTKSDYITTFVTKGGVAESLGIKEGDQIYEFAGRPALELTSLAKFKEVLRANLNKETSITFVSKVTGEKLTKTFTPTEKNGQVLFGIAGLFYDIQLSNVNGLAFGVNRTMETVQLNFSELGKIVKALVPTQKDKSALDNLGGPIGASNQINNIFSKNGFTWETYLSIMAMVSVSLAVFNLLPIPALDGGRWIIITLNKVLGKRNRKLEGIVVGYTFLALMGLGLFIAFWDVFRIFGTK